MAAPADARDGADEAPALPDDDTADLSSSSTIVDAETLRMLEAFSVELVEPGEANPGLIKQLVQLRERTCLSVGRYDIGEHCAHRPMFLGWLNDQEGHRPVAALYVAPTADWIVRRCDLLRPSKKTSQPLADARFLSVLDLDCESDAVDHRLAWRLLRDALKTIGERAPGGARAITYSTSPGLRAFLRRLLRPDLSDIHLFWHVMTQTARVADFGSLDDMAAQLGNLVELAEQLISPAQNDLRPLLAEQGDPLERYLQALATVYCAELFDKRTGHHLCPVSRFHHYHGGKLIKVVAGSDPTDVASLSVVLHFEYTHDRMSVRRGRYRTLRRRRREPSGTGDHNGA